jgi:hypothetical protein
MRTASHTINPTDVTHVGCFHHSMIIDLGAPENDERITNKTARGRFRFEEKTHARSRDLKIVWLLRQ